MSRNTLTAPSSCAVECMESGRAQTEAQNPTITSSNDIQSTHSSTPQRIVQFFSSPSLQDSHNDSRDNTHNDKDILNQLAYKMVDIGLNGSDNTSNADPLMKHPDENNMPQPIASGIGSVESGTQTGDLAQPVIVMSSQASSPPVLGGRRDSEPIIVDEPDPKLLDALRKPLDRPLILKLEQDVIAFVTGVLDSYDTSPLNSYHRMLVHKIAEFYRLTHIVSPDANDCVRLFRGHAARIPPVKLSDMASTKSPPGTPPSGPQVAVKIMRRKSPSQQSFNGEMDQPGNGRGNGRSQGSDSSKSMTREEKEAAYQLARARIFGDFKESLSESPPPSKTINEKQAPQRSNRDREDEFQSRSQYYPVSHPFHTFELPGARFPSVPPPAYGFSGPLQSSHILNPTAISFNPNANPFTPNHQVRPAQQMISQQYPIPLPHGSGYPIYPSPQAPHMPFSANQPNYGRPPLTPNPPSFNGPLMAQPPPSRLQAGYGSNCLGMPGFSPMGIGFPLSSNNNLKHSPSNRIPDPHVGNGATYPTNLPFAGQQNSNTISTVTGGMNSTINGGWSAAKSQPARFQQGEGAPLADALSGNLGSYGAGKG